MTARAWVLDPPCDWLMASFTPASFSYAGMNSALIARQSSRVGSYDTFNSSRLPAGAASPAGWLRHAERATTITSADNPPPIFLIATP